MYDFQISEDGFCGYLHRSQTPWDEKQVLIVVGGTESSEVIPKVLGKMFANEGIDTLGVCYWNVPGGANEYVNIELDQFEKAVAYLESQGYERIGIYGYSRGAEVALQVAARIPKITRIAAVSPTHVSWSGLSGGRLLMKHLIDSPAFTWHGEPIPYYYIKSTVTPDLRSIVQKFELNLRHRYVRALDNVPEDAVIEVEKLNGDLLLLYPERDTIWPSDISVRAIEKRLATKGWTHNVEAVSYRYSSHVLVPCDYAPLWLFKSERKNPNRCAKSRMQAFEKALKFFK